SGQLTSPQTAEEKGLICPDSEEAVQVCVTDQQGRKDWSDCLCQSSGESACTEVGRVDPSDYCQQQCDSGSGQRYCTSTYEGDLEWGLCYCDSDTDIGTIPDGPPGGGGGVQILPQTACPDDFDDCGWMPEGSLLCRYCEVTLLETGECLLWSDWMLCGALP
ncbi:MAG: hypothetical protein AAFX50_15270, partial [Acidobacteriota bacterium]